MKRKGFYIIFLLWAAFAGQSCSKCGDCFRVPEPFFFNVVDSVTGENLFRDSTFLPSDIRVVRLPDSSGKYFSFIGEDKKDLIMLQFTGTDSTQSVDYGISVKQQPLFTLHLYINVLQNKCCTFTRYDSVRIGQAITRFDTATGVYTVFVTPDTTQPKKIR